uniref:TIGR03503 family protein n=1 Tax=Thaumasiovibrio occultus TaxID=1891184 RepID=UPI000B35B1D4|nr:TIGR03503 family protein [Thaumasiovibrio occultus]
MLTRFALALLGLCLSPMLCAEESAMRWLDNRFRVDPSIERITFMIHREEGTGSAVLIRPDGSKFYAWKHPDEVNWYQDGSMDIVTVNSPMPGPWQAMGQITPDNGIELISDITMIADDFPDRLYQNEAFKFTARIFQDGQPMANADFLERVELNVEFVKANDVDVQRQQVPIELGRFINDGREFDEIADDSTFTIGLNVDLDPGRYYARVSSDNGIFMRSVDKEVLVYPAPMRTSFIQGRHKGESHQLSIEPDDGAFVPGSLSVHIEQTLPDGSVMVEQSQSAPDEDRLDATMHNTQKPGQYRWQAWVYGTAKYGQRDVVFTLPEKSFAIQAELEFDRHLEEFRLANEAREREAEEARLAEEKAQKEKSAFFLIIALNISVVVIALVVIMVIKKRRMPKPAPTAVASGGLAEPD